MRVRIYLNMICYDSQKIPIEMSHSKGPSANMNICLFLAVKIIIWLNEKIELNMTTRLICNRDGTVMAHSLNETISNKIHPTFTSFMLDSHLL